MNGDNEELERSGPQSQSVYPDTDPKGVTQGEHNAPYKNFFLGAYEGSKETTQKGNSSSKDIYPKIYHLGMKTNIMTIETGNVFPEEQAERYGSGFS